jgi:hypothetical protein
MLNTKSGILKFLKTYEWPIVWILAVFAFCLGLIGFRQHYPARTQLDVVYLALQLFTMESGAPAGRVGVLLNIARFLAPAVTVYAAAKALAVIFQRQLQLVRMKTIHNHVVIAGLGRSGMLFVEAYRKKGQPVVIIERNEANEQLVHCQDAGALTLVGDARAQDILSRAGVNRAKVLICVTGEDGINAEIAVQTRDLLMFERQTLTSLVHIVDSELCRLLRKQELMGRKGNLMRMEFFNIYESAVRDLFARHPPFDQSPQAGFLIVGLGQMGESLLLALTRFWMQEPSKPSPRFNVSILDRFASRKVEALQVRYPYLVRNCILTPFEIEVPSTEFYQKEFLKTCEPAAVYLTIDNDSVVLSTALLLRQWVDAKTPIFARMSHQGGLATLLSRSAEQKTETANVIPFGAAERICTPDLISGSTKEILARVIHEEYVRSQLHQPSSNPAVSSWEELPEWLKESNRTQADHIGEKLKRIGCDLVLFSDEEAESFEFDEKELEALARMEHERWIEERTKDGWKYAPGDKNVKHKTNPYLVSYDQLPEEIQEYNRNTVRELPRFLARAGYQIYRI